MKWMIAWLASYPRSGNTFLRIILHRTFGLPTFSVYSSARDAERLAGDAARLLNLVGQTGVECDIDALRADAGLHFVKTHELPDPNNSSPAIVLVRDGRDAVVSYAYFALKTEQGIERPGRELLESTLEQIIAGETFGGWSRNVNAWIDRAGRGSVIRFEDLIEDPVAIVAAALRRLGFDCRAGVDAAPSFQELHSAVPWFFRRGKPRTWRREMPRRLQQLFADRHGAALLRLGYQEVPPQRRLIPIV